MGEKMDHLLAGTEIALTYLQDRRALDGIDWADVFDDLIDAGAAPNRCQWSDLDALTHVVLATSRSSGCYLGLLGLVKRETANETYLSIDAAMSRPGDDGALMGAMLAHVLARIVCLDGKPVAISTSRHERMLEPLLRRTGLAISGAVLHPPENPAVIPFATAVLARRIGQIGAMLDLRPVTETGLLRDLRRLHRVGPEFRKALAAPIAELPATPAGATRRPRTATRTGRSG